jgi:predicted lipid-binding transport protein (Tim44 family)
LSDLPLMDSVKNYDDIDFIFIVADNATADYWVSIVNAQYGVPMACGASAVMAPRFYSFIGSGQLHGLLGGMKGAAEYEQLIGHKGRAFRGMAVQSLIHLLIIALVILGNLSFFMSRRRRRRVTP